MGAKYTKAQAKATAKYTKQFVEIKIRVTEEKRQEYKRMAETSGKTMKQFIIDRIEGQE